MKTKNSSKAFSLIELSIVILVVGILIAGITQSSSLVRKFKLHSAKSLTKSSPVNGIRNLVVWYETSLDESLLANEASNNNPITRWKNISPQTIENMDLVTSFASPTFIENGINQGIPTISFNGGQSMVLTPFTALNTTGKTFFVVAKTRSPLANGRVIAYGDMSFFRGISFLNSNAVGFFDSATGGAVITMPLSSSTSFKIITGYRKNDAIFISLNGSPSASLTNNNTPNTNVTALFVGAGFGGNSSMLNGEIAEIIIYSETLTSEERSSVEKYLSQKYAIPLF